MSCAGLQDVDPLRVATRTISGLYDGATTSELDQLSIQTAAGLIVEEPNDAWLAGRLLATYIDQEVRNQDVYAFSRPGDGGAVQRRCRGLHGEPRDLRGVPVSHVTRPARHPSGAASSAPLRRGPLHAYDERSDG